MRLSDLSSGDVRQMTEILRLLPSEQDPIQYNNRVWKLTDELPSRLKSTGFFNRILSWKSALDSRPMGQQGPLCPIHQKLNPPVIHKVYTLIALEVGYRLNHLVQNLHTLDEGQQALIGRLRSLHAVWYEPDKYSMLFYQRAEDTKWAYQGNKCAACTLSLIAGDSITILDLLCAVMSRSGYGEKHATPRLFAWLMAWLSHHKDDQPDESSKNAFMCQIYENEIRTLDLRYRRKEFSKRRKAATAVVVRSPRMQSVPELEELAFGNDETYDEGRIISLYQHIDDDDLDTIDFDAALLSTPHLPNMNQFLRDQSQRSLSNLSSDSCRGSQPHQSRWQTSDEAANSYANVLDRNNPFASSVSIFGQTSAASRRSSLSATGTPGSPVWTDCNPTVRTNPSRSTLTSYAHAVPANCPESSILEQYANYTSHSSPKTNLHRPSALARRTQQQGTSRYQHLQGTCSPAASANKPNAPSPKLADTMLHRSQTLGRQVSTSSHASNRSPPTATTLNCRNSTHDSRPASEASTSTGQTRWSTHWREELENRPENAFYRERERERKRQRRGSASD